MIVQEDLEITQNLESFTTTYTTPDKLARAKDTVEWFAGALLFERVGIVWLDFSDKYFSQ